jgi:signal transduction histidine kinase
MSQDVYLVPVVSTTHRLVRYGIVVGSLALAILASLFARPLIEPNPFLLFFAAVAVSAWFGGLGPGILTTVLAAFISHYIFLAPGLPLSLDVSNLARLGGFLLVALTFCVLSEARLRGAATHRFLGEASGILATSLDYAITIERVAHLLVPTLADWCAVHILEDGHTVRRLTLVHRDPTKQAMARGRAERYPLDAHATHLVPAVLRSGQAELIPRVRQAQLAAAARDADHLALLQALDARTYLCVPLRLRGQTFGTLTLARGGSRRGYRPADIALAEALADRAAVALDNARLYQTAQAEIQARQQADTVLKAERAQLARQVEARTADLQVANADLARALQAKDTFLAHMSHELRTPLNAVIGFTGTLLMKLPGPLTADQEKQLLTIQSSARHLLSLINDLLDLAKIESGTVEVNREPVVGQEMIREVVASLHPLAEQKGLRITVATPTNAIELTTDRRTLSQILINLVSNAIKFTEHGQVQLMLRECYEHDQRWIAISVADTGIGLRPEAQAKLFQAFTQVDTATSRRQEGTGLGLHVSQKLAHLLGGRITVQSEYGAGSTFTLDLPAV